MKKSTILLYVVLLLLKTNFSLGQGVVINEVQSSNSTTIADESGNYEDWIELFNTTSSDINLSGYGLSDDSKLPFKWVFPDIVLGSKQYLLIWASDKNRRDPAAPLHTNFKLSSSGQTVSLTSPSNILMDRVIVKALKADISYGRSPNGTGSFVFFDKCTPNSANAVGGFSELLSPPIFSVDSGFFTQGFNLTLTSVPGATILYTLDGSEPSENNLGGTTYIYKNQYAESPGQTGGPLLQKNYKTLTYSSALSITDRSSSPNKIASISSTYNFNPYYIPTNPITKATVVRAKAVKTGALSSPSISKSYFIFQQGSNRFKLPVISLSINEDELFDYYKGIYVAGVDFEKWRTLYPNLEPGSTEGIGNYYRISDQDERVANFTYLVNGKEVLNQDIGISIHGGASRRFQSKSLSIYPRSKYGNNSLDYRFFSDIENVKFKRLVLRNSGTDFVWTMFRDALNQELCKSLHCITESYQPTVTFINGEYWGILNIREKYSDEYFSEKYNINKDEIDFIEVPEDAQEGDNLNYLDMTNYFNKNNLADNSKYNYIKTRLDPESFSDFFIANIFFQNSDWPGNNVQCWRKRTNGYITNAPEGHDGRWRWAFHDMDNTFDFGTDEDFSANTLAAATALNGPPYPNPEWSTLFLRKLLENTEFKNNFINRFADLMNTAFLSSRIISKIDEMKSVIEPEIGEHISRWKIPVDVSQWNSYITFEQKFANERPAFQRQHIRQKFGISSDLNVTLDVSDATQGYIKMNTIDIIPSTPGVPSNPYPWKGIYFNSIPVKIKAVALPGYAFSHWSGASSSTSAEITLTPTSDLSLTAHFTTSTDIETPEVIYFWMMDDAIKNNVPLTSINSTYHLSNNVGTISYQSCLVGYPFASTDLNNYRIADLERRNSPTSLNYISQANQNKSYAATGMTGIQIKQPFQSGGLENNLIFNFSTFGYKRIKFDVAALDEGAATGITLEYSTNPGAPNWTSVGLTKNSFPIFNTYQLIEADFTTIAAANNNPDFKIRLRFTGPNMTANTYKNVTLNNASVQGIPINKLSDNDYSIPDFVVYPNPVKNMLNVLSQYNSIEYKIISIDGKITQKGKMDNNELNLSFLSPGLYLLQLTADGKSEMKKFIKN